MKNTITSQQEKELWNLLDQYQEQHNYPDFWSMPSTDDDRFFTIEVQDFDGKHDFGFLSGMLAAAGIELDSELLLDSTDLVRLEREDQPRPLMAATIDGDGELGRLYGFELIRESAIEKPLYTAILHFGAVTEWMQDTCKARLEKEARNRLLEEGEPHFPSTMQAHAETQPFRYSILDMDGNLVEKLPCVLRRDKNGRKYWAEA